MRQHTSLARLQRTTFPRCPQLCPGDTSRGVQPLKTCPWHHPRQKPRRVRSEKRQPKAGLELGSSEAVPALLTPSARTAPTSLLLPAHASFRRARLRAEPAKRLHSPTQGRQRLRGEVRSALLPVAPRGAKRGAAGTPGGCGAEPGAAAAAAPAGPARSVPSRRGAAFSALSGRRRVSPRRAG